MKNHPQVPRFLHPNSQFHEIARAEPARGHLRILLCHRRQTPSTADDQRACLAREEMEILSRSSHETSLGWGTDRRPWSGESERPLVDLIGLEAVGWNCGWNRFPTRLLR